MEDYSLAPQKVSAFSFYPQVWKKKNEILACGLPWLLLAIVGRVLVRLFSEPEAMNASSYIFTITNGLEFQNRALYLSGTPEGLQIPLLAWLGHCIFLTALGLFAADLFKIFSNHKQEISPARFALLPVLFCLFSFVFMGVVYGVSSMHSQAVTASPNFVSATFKPIGGGPLPQRPAPTRQEIEQRNHQSKEKPFTPVLQKIYEASIAPPVMGIRIDDDKIASLERTFFALKAILFLSLLFYSPLLVQRTLGLPDKGFQHLGVKGKDFIDNARMIILPLAPLWLVLNPLSPPIENLRNFWPPYAALGLWVFVYSFTWFSYIAVLCYFSVRASGNAEE